MSKCICENSSIRYVHPAGDVRTAPVKVRCAEHAPAARAAQAKHDAGVREAWLSLLRPACLRRLALPAPSMTGGAA